MDRRNFVQAATLLPAMGFMPLHSSDNNNSKAKNTSKIKLSVSSYSYWHFKGEKYPIQKVIDQAALLGLEGIDVLHRQMESEDNAYLQMLNAMTCLSIHQGFVTPDKEELKKNVAHTIHCIELAYKMGIPCMRLNTGRWNTIKSFDDLMKNKGIEPVLSGYSEEDGYK